MFGPNFIALADDLTGAAELAAIGQRMGLRSVVCTEGQSPRRPAELIVHDTDSRLCTPAEAARRVRTAIANVMRSDPTALIFKKVDSVLRGPVAAELAAAADALGKPRVLLVPANPSLGRTVLDGIYRLGGVPVAETAFRRDPHHPVRSSRVVDMLGVDAALPVSSAAISLTALPTGVVIGDAACIADLNTWAKRLGNGTLPAGGAEFFAAWLRNHRCSPVAPSEFPHVPRPMLIIAGSTTPASRENLATAAAAGFALLPLPEALLAADDPSPALTSTWSERVARALHVHRVAIVSSAGITANAPWIPEAIRRAFATLAAQLHHQRAFKHLLIEGGATAAAAAHALGWTEFVILREWAPGVASLRPVHASDICLTIKPGSYAWPAQLWHQLTDADATLRASLRPEASVSFQPTADHTS